MSTPAARNAVVTYDAGWETNCVTWSSVPEPQRLAVSSFIGDGPNHVSILEKNPATEKLERVGQIAFFYPPTKIAFAPSAAVAGSESDLLVTSSDFLRIWNVRESAPGGTTGSTTIGTHESQQQAAVSGGSPLSPNLNAPAAPEPFRRLTVDQRHLFKFSRSGGGAAGAGTSSSSGGGTQSAAAPGGGSSSSRGNSSSSAAVAAPPPGTTHAHHPATSADDFPEPVTSFDWNVDKPSMIAATSVDTTISVWDIIAQQLTIQLIAHDKPVYDCSFAPGESVFASCGADGSVRVFDLRCMENCTIVYEEGPANPMLRVGWSRKSPYIAATIAESPRVVIIDMRNPSTPVCAIANHEAPINSIAWAPQYGQTLCCVGEDRRALIWDINTEPQSPPTPQMTYEAEAPINGVAWSRAHDDWVSIAFGTKVSLLLV